MFWDRKGEPIDSLERLNELLGDPAYKILKTDQVNGYLVRTVWGGIDHATGEASKPLIFTTGVFRDGDSNHGLGEFIEERAYATEDEALAGHDETVLLISGMPPSVPDIHGSVYNSGPQESDSDQESPD